MKRPFITVLGSRGCSLVLANGTVGHGLNRGIPATPSIRARSRRRRQTPGATRAGGQIICDTFVDEAASTSRILTLTCRAGRFTRRATITATELVGT